MAGDQLRSSPGNCGQRTAESSLLHPRRDQHRGYDRDLTKAARLRVVADVRASGVPVEMEALTAVSVACLTLFDMLKAIDRPMIIGGIAVTAKQGGQSGDWASGQ